MPACSLEGNWLDDKTGWRQSNKSPFSFETQHLAAPPKPQTVLKKINYVKANVRWSQIISITPCWRAVGLCQVIFHCHNVENILVGLVGLKIRLHFSLWENWSETLLQGMNTFIAFELNNFSYFLLKGLMRLSVQGMFSRQSPRSELSLTICAAMLSPCSCLIIWIVSAT